MTRTRGESWSAGERGFARSDGKSGAFAQILVPCRMTASDDDAGHDLKAETSIWGSLELFPRRRMWGRRSVVRLFTVILSERLNP